MQGSQSSSLSYAVVSRLSIYVGGLLTAIALTAGPAWASSFTLTTTANASISGGGSSQNTRDGAITWGTNETIDAVAAGGLQFLNLNSSLGVDARAFVQGFPDRWFAGVLAGISGNIEIAIGGPVNSSGFTGSADANVSISDHLTVIGGPSSGVLALDFRIEGNLSALADVSVIQSFPTSASATARLTVNDQSHMISTSVGATVGRDVLSQSTATSFFPGAYTVLLPYTNGQTNLGVDFFAEVTGKSTCGVGAGQCLVLGVAGLGHTLELSDIVVQDTLGNVISGAFALGDSGIAYNNSPASGVTAVPEPATLGLLLVGALGLRRRRLR